MIIFKQHFYYTYNTLNSLFTLILNISVLSGPMSNVILLCQNSSQHFYLYTLATLFAYQLHLQYYSFKAMQNFRIIIWIRQ
jgi:hypothetical protein